jgi:hypothetical protein
MKKLKKTIGEVGQSREGQRHCEPPEISPRTVSLTPEHCSTSISPEEELGEFEARIAQLQAEAEVESLNWLFLKERGYGNLPNLNCYLTTRQPELDWLSRAVTMNWMLEILSELGAKREVFALAANYVDRYLASTDALPLGKLQLLACAAMSLANKVEGMSFTLECLTKGLFPITEVM